VAAVSAGAAIACVLFAGVTEESLRYFKQRAAHNEHNAYPRNLFSGRPVFPHESIYRDTILQSLDDAGLRRLHAGPDVRVLLAQVPAWLGPRSAIVAGYIASQAEHLMRPRVHKQIGRKIGFVPAIVSVRDCRSPEEVADLILQSSCTPPFTTLYRRDGWPVLDGCLVDSVPVDALDGSASPTLVLLTRRYPRSAIPRVEGRTYVQPSEPIPIDAWDYTSPRGIDITYDLGRRDGERFVAEVEQGGDAAAS
jgi:predicted patatin/cPLA2 family phospholipase